MSCELDLIRGWMGSRGGKGMEGEGRAGKGREGEGSSYNKALH